jgi:lipopolysaccharide biosynthesis protein
MHAPFSPALEVFSGMPSSKAVYGEQNLNPRNKIRPIAFYLPQFHRVAENDEWWGPGFTEWTNVSKARPNFDGHFQPQIPSDLGFYDLSYVDNLRKQVDLAREYGVYGFCFYHYWFSGRRILEKPVNLFVESDINFPYCLCWANENWTRTWDGDTRSVLLEQKYLDSDPENFIDSLQDHLKDPRYIRVANKPLLLVYRAKAIPHCKETFARWRQHAHKIGIGEIHISVVDFYDVTTPDEFGADSITEFPPHKFNLPGSAWPKKVNNINKKFSGYLLDYRKAIQTSVNRPVESYTVFRAAMPTWDNTARRQNTSSVFLGSSPELFELWLRYISAWTQEQAQTKDEPYIFINAWNEWAEGAHLEPDTKHGRAWLQAVFSAVKASTAHTTSATVSAQIASFYKDHLKLSTSWELQPARLNPSLKMVQRVSDLSRKIPGLHALLKKIYYKFFG